MQRALRSFLVAAALGSLVVFPATAHAQRAATQIVGLYMTTEEAYNAYSNNSPAPPRVDAFPQGVSIVGVYLHYRGAKPHKTTYRVGFRHNGAEVRHGVLHTFDYVAGETVLSIPADEMQVKGAYQATLYVDGRATLTTNFSVIRTPTVDSAYMITAKAWDAYNPNGKSDPPKATGFPAGVARVGAFFSYSGMAKADLHYVAVYDALGNLVHRSQNHDAAGYVPDGSIAIILPADAGHYPKGQYRTDLYVNGAMVKSLPWSAK
jgi:hypothetical protein